ISWRTDKNANEVLLTHADSDQVTIQRFGEDVIKINPDFVLSFEGNSIHWPYLVKRANKTKTPLRVGRDEGPPHQSLFGHYSLIGRANVDLLISPRTSMRSRTKLSRTSQNISESNHQIRSLSMRQL